MSKQITLDLIKAYRVVNLTEYQLGANYLNRIVTKATNETLNLYIILVYKQRTQAFEHPNFLPGTLIQKLNLLHRPSTSKGLYNLVSTSMLGYNLDAVTAASVPIFPDKHHNISLAAPKLQKPLLNIK